MRTVAVIAAALLAALLAAPRRMVAIPRPGRPPTGMALAAAIGASAALLVWSIDAPPAVAMATGVLVAPIPVGLRRSARRKATAREAMRWPDFLAAVRARIATGATLPEATRAAARHLGGRFLDLDRGSGEPYRDLLHRTRESWAEPVADRVLTTLAIASEVGGHHVESILAALSGSIADEIRLRRAHESALTQQRLTAAVALVAPWALLALSVATNPSAADAYATTTGTWIVAAGLAATIAGYALARRSARLAEPPRTFR